MEADRNHLGPSKMLSIRSTVIDIKVLDEKIKYAIKDKF